MSSSTHPNISVYSYSHFLFLSNIVLLCFHSCTHCLAVFLLALLISPTNAMSLWLSLGMGKLRVASSQWSITSSPTSSLSWKFVEDLEFSPKLRRCWIFTAFLTWGNLVKMPPLHKISDHTKCDIIKGVACSSKHLPPHLFVISSKY